MLEKIIKKEHSKIIWSLYGILTMVSFILPLVMIGFGIWFVVSKINNYGWVWIVLGAAFILFSFRKLKDFIPIIRYAINPKKFKTYKTFIEDGFNPIDFDQELEEADVISNLNKKNPLIVTEHFIFGFSQVQFFFLRKEDVVWVYEYNGNGLVFYDRHKIYGFTFFQTVDGNDEAIAKLEDEMPYIYYGIDFDYKRIMHDEFEETLEEIRREKEKFEADPENYRAEKIAQKKAREEEETKRLEEEKNRQLQELLKGHEEELEEEKQNVEDLEEVERIDETPSSEEEIKEKEE